MWSWIITQLVIWGIGSSPTKTENHCFKQISGPLWNRQFVLSLKIHIIWAEHKKPVKQLLDCPAPPHPTPECKETQPVLLCQPWPCCVGDKRPGELGQLPLREAINAADLRKIGRLPLFPPSTCRGVSDVFFNINDDDDGGARVMKGNTGWKMARVDSPGRQITRMSV